MEIAEFHFIDGSGDLGILFTPHNPAAASVRVTHTMGEYTVFVEELAEDSAYGIGDTAAADWAFSRVDAVARFGVARCRVKWALGLGLGTVVVIRDSPLTESLPGPVSHEWQRW